MSYQHYPVADNFDYREQFYKPLGAASDMLNNIPSSITVFREASEPNEVIEEEPHVQKHDSEYFNLRPVYDEYGDEDVVIDGDARKFISNIHDELINFLKTYKVPIKSLSSFLLDSINDRVIAEFLSRTDWWNFSREERLLYHRLNDWIYEPADKKISDLISKEADNERREKLSQILDTLIDPEITEVQYPNTQAAKSQASVPGPSRTKTTPEERRIIKEWTHNNPKPTRHQRKEFVESTGLAPQVVYRLSNYYSKAALKDNKTSPLKPEVKQSEQVEHEESTPSISSGMDTHMKQIINNIKRKNQNDLNFKKDEITEAIKKAVESGTLTGLNMKKPMKIILKKSEGTGNNPDTTKKEFVSSSPGFGKISSENQSLEKDLGNKYNFVALSSYFKTKPFPTDEEIQYFTSCTRVPHEITMRYISRMQNQHAQKSSHGSMMLDSGHQKTVEKKINTFPSQSDENICTDPEANVFSQSSAGLVSELSDEQKYWFQKFLLDNPRPDMKKIEEFANNMGMQIENFNIFFQNQPHLPEVKQDDKTLLFNSLHPEIFQLVKDVHDFKPENFSPLLIKELKSMFGEKVFLTLDNVKSFSSQKNLSFQDVYRQLNKHSDSVQLVSDETCRRLLTPEHDDDDLKHVKAEAADTNDWLTNSDLDFESEQFQGEQRSTSPKRKHMIDNLETEEDFSKKQKTSIDDSGYATPNNSQTETENQDLIDNILTENLRDVNILDESLNLFNESISNVDLVSEMFNNVVSEGENQIQSPREEKKSIKDSPKKEDSVVDQIIASLEKSQVTDDEAESGTKKQEHLNTEMRQVFRGPLQNFSPVFQVLSTSTSFKSYVYQVELSDGEASSKNFYFKTGAAALEVNMMVKLKIFRHVGAKICVDNFEIIERRGDIMGDPQELDEDYYRKLREEKIKPLEMTRLDSPRTILDYVMLEENLTAFIEHRGVRVSEIFEESDPDVKRQILFSLCKTQKEFPNKIVKLLERLLKMKKEMIVETVEEALKQLENRSDNISEDHSYSSLCIKL